MLRSRILVLFLTAILAVSCYSQDASPPQIDAQASALLAQCRSVMGTPDKALSLLLTGSIIDTDHVAIARDLKIETRGAYHERRVEAYAQGTVTRIYAGRAAWKITGDKKTPLSVSETRARIPEFMPAYACAQRSERANMDVQFVGREDRDGTSVDHLHVGFLHRQPASLDETFVKAIAELDLYLDAGTHAVFGIKREEFNALSSDTHITVELRFTGYQTVAGVQVPMHSVHYLNGRSIEDTTITQVTQESFSDAEFK